MSSSAQKRLKDQEIEEFISAIPLFSEYREGSNDHEAITALREASTPKERAEELKESGNMAFKLGRKRWADAVIFYSQAIDEDCGDPAFQSILYANRAQVLLSMGNYGKCVSDCLEALKLNRQNSKAYFRAAQASKLLRKFDHAVVFARDGLKECPNISEGERKALSELLQHATQLHENDLAERSQREAAERGLRRYREFVEAEIAKRHIKMRSSPFDPSWRDASPYDLKVDVEINGQPAEPLFLNPPDSQPVAPAADARTELFWPVVFAYPEYFQTDFIQRMSEMHTFEDHLRMMFPPDGPAAPWDVRGEYVASALKVYLQVALENHVHPEAKKLVAVKPGTCLLTLLQRRDFKVGLPVTVAVVSAAYEPVFCREFAETQAQLDPDYSSASASSIK